MSEDNSGRGKQKQSFEEADSDQVAYLDSLIAQFQGDSDVVFPEHKNRPQPSANSEAEVVESAISGPEESPAQTAATTEVAGEPEAAEQNNRLKILLICMIPIALIGAIWMTISGDGDRHVVSDIAKTLTEMAPIAVPQVAPGAAPEAVASTADVVPEDAAVETVLPDQAEPAVPAQEQPDIPVQAEPLPEIVQDPEVDPEVGPVLPEMAAPKAGKTTWVVNLASVSTPAMAGQIQEELGSRGIASERVQVTVGGESYYRIFVPGFSSKQEAGEARLQFLKQREFSGAWVTRYRTAIRSPE